MAAKGLTFSSIVFGTPVITLDKLNEVRIICHGRILLSYGLLVMAKRIISLL